MEMLKEEPKPVYVYEYIKIDKDRPPKLDGSKWEIGNIFISDDANKNKKFYKFVCTIRRAFVGNMQEEFDKAWECNNMEVFAKTSGNRNREFIYARVSSIKKDVWFKKLWKDIWNKFKLNKQVDSFEEFLSGEKNFDLNELKNTKL